MSTGRWSSRMVGGRTVDQGGRAKAYRPLPEPERRAAIEAGIAAYERGDWFLAHELLEPAWMGTRDLGERELTQGLIKLAAAFVHAARGNPTGFARNLRGARDRIALGRGAGDFLGVDVPLLLTRVEEVLAALTPAAGASAIDTGAVAIPIPRRGPRR